MTRLCSSGTSPFMPRVSVVIPAYNAESFLPAALDSIASQSYDDWDVVVADDASTDRTSAIVEERGGRIRLVRSEVNEGPAGARNRALAQASGELVVFLDADDRVRPAYLDRMVELYDDNCARGVRVGIVSCDAELIAPDGAHPQSYMDLCGFSGEVTIEAMLVSNLVPPGSMIRRGLIDEIGGFCTELFGTEDYDLWLRILEAGYQLVATHEKLVVYRVRSGSVSSDLPRMARSLQLTYRRALERGSLTQTERRVAERQLRLQSALEQVGLALADRRHGRNSLRRIVRSLPLFARVAVENPDRWASAARTLVGRRSLLSQVGR